MILDDYRSPWMTDDLDDLQQLARTFMSKEVVPHLNPTDKKNMNRFYPGNPNGTQTDRASYVVTKEVVEKSDHLIDFHGGDLDENLRPYSYWTVTGNQKQDEKRPERLDEKPIKIP